MTPPPLVLNHNPTSFPMGVCNNVMDSKYVWNNVPLRVWMSVSPLLENDQMCFFLVKNWRAWSWILLQCQPWVENGQPKKEKSPSIILNKLWVALNSCSACRLNKRHFFHWIRQGLLTYYNNAADVYCYAASDYLKNVIITVKLCLSNLLFGVCQCY